MDFIEQYLRFIKEAERLRPSPARLGHTTGGAKARLSIRGGWPCSPGSPLDAFPA